MGKEIINTTIYTLSGFFDRFYELCEQHPDRLHKEIFEDVNAEHEQLFGREKYTDYNSFKSSKSRYYRNLRRRAQNRKEVNLKQKVNNVNRF